MKFTIPTQEFNYMLNRCLSLIPTKTTLPILGNVLVEAANGILSLTSSDLTVGVRCFSEVKIDEEGSTTLPAKKLAQLVRELTAVNVQVSTNATHITEIKADGSRFKLHGMSKESFPSLPDLSEGVKFQTKQGQLKDVLSRTAFAVSRDENRFVLTGVCMNIAGGIATFIGTDGKRLARNILPVDVDKALKASYVMPIKAIEEVLKVLTDEGNVTIYLTSDKLAFETEDTFIVTKLLEGEYPDLNQVIPQAVPKKVTLHRDELIVLLKQVGLFSGERNQVRFLFEEGELKLSADSAEQGEGHVSMPANYHGEPLEIAFNPTFFVDILRHNRGETVSLGITDAFNPGVITEESEEEFAGATANPLYVLMPMRLEE